MPGKKLAGMEYDWRRPTATRFRSRAWNPNDPRMFTPKTFGWGFGFNFFWLVHPIKWMRTRRS